VSNNATLKLDLKEVGFLCINGEWLVARNITPVRFESAFGWEDGFRFTEGQRTVYAPKSAVTAVAGRHLDTVEESEAAETERLARAEALFERQHRASREVYTAALEKQGGTCPGCRQSLRGHPVTHYDERTEQVLCGPCSPYRHNPG